MSIYSRRATIQMASWPDIARQLAKNAHRTTTLRRFFGECKADDFVFTYIGNGNPYSNEPSLREAEHQLFREWCQQEKVTILAEVREETDHIVIIILDLSDTVADCKRFGDVFTKYTSLAASPQAFQLATELGHAAHKVTIG